MADHHGPVLAGRPPNERSKTCLLVALANGDVRLYDDEKNLLHTLKTMEPIAALRFGPYAREEGALAVVSTTGGWVSVGAVHAALVGTPTDTRYIPFLSRDFALLPNM